MTDAMKPLLVLAGNQKEYRLWERENGDALRAAGLSPRYMPTQTLNYLMYKNCYYTEIGSCQHSPAKIAIYGYFETHNIAHYDSSRL